MASKTYTGIPLELAKQPTAEIEKSKFDPRYDVSADAKYLVKNLVLWFLVAPIVFGILAAVVINAAR